MDENEKDKICGEKSCEGCDSRGTCENAPKEEAERTEEHEADNDTAGLDYLTRLSYACIDRSDLPDEEKRGLLFSVYSFRCLFDGKELHRLSAVLVRNGCSFFTTDENAQNYEHVYKIEKDGRTVYKFDAGSPYFRHAVAARKIPAKFASVPEKFTLYEAALKTVTLNTATAELKALWLVYFPYVFMMGAPVEHDIYDELKKAVHTPDTFSAANESRYADNICCTAAELAGEDPFIADWYLPFIEWKCVKNDKGISRETAKYQRALARGDYAYAVAGTEKLLDSFPDDEEILLLNISARTSMAPKVGLRDRVKLLSQTYSIICDALDRSVKKYNYFMYYRGLTRLGMQDADGAEADFKACLDSDPHFEPALLMLKGMDKLENKSDN